MRSNKTHENLVMGALPAYCVLARSMARRANLPSHVGDLESVAALSLWESALKFNPTINNDFSKACYLRVCGAMVDYLRSLGGRSRSGAWRTFVCIDAQALNVPAVDLTRTLPPRWGDLLTKREKLILQGLYWDDRTAKDVGISLDLGEDRVRQLRREAIHKLRSIYVKKTIQ